MIKQVFLKANLRRNISPKGVSQRGNMFTDETSRLLVSEVPGIFHGNSCSGKNIVANGFF